MDAIYELRAMSAMYKGTPWNYMIFKTIYMYTYQRRIQGRAAGHSPPPPEEIPIFLFLISIKIFKITHYEDDEN